MIILVIIEAATACTGLGCNMRLIGRPAGCSKNLLDRGSAKEGPRALKGCQRLTLIPVLIGLCTQDPKLNAAGRRRTRLLEWTRLSNDSAVHTHTCV